MVSPYLLNHRITKIDYMIVSHFDSDHCGGLFYILENFKVKNIIIGKQFSEYDNLIEFLKLNQTRKSKIIVGKGEDTIEIDPKTRIEIMFPDIHHIISENEINNNSLVFKLWYRDTSILFTGDIEEEGENVLIDLYGKQLKSDILKVGHHGSKTSSTEKFIKLVEPKIALIGVGKNNNFGHPSQEILDRLQENKIMVYRTDEDGEISVFINEKGYYVTKNNTTFY